MTFEALEARFLLATSGITSGAVQPDSSATTQQPTSHPLAAISRIDNYDLPASPGYPEVKFQVQWGASDRTQGAAPQALLIVLPTDGSPASQYGLIGPGEVDWMVPIPAGAGGVEDPDWLSIKFRINPATDAATVAGSNVAGTYDLSVGWVSPVPLPPASSSGLGDGASAPTGATVASGAAANPQPTAPASISVVGKLLPASDAAPLAPWLSQSAPGQLPPTGSYAAIPSPAVLAPANLPTSPVTIPTVTLPGGVATPGASAGVSPIVVAPTGPFLLPAGAPPALRGEARPSSPGSFGDGSGPPLIVGPLPLGRSEPDGGIFARSFSSTAGSAGLAGAEPLVAVAMPSGVGQSGSMTPPWPGSLGRSMSGHRLTPYGVDQDPSGQATMPPATPSPLAASDGEKPRREGVVLLPSLAVAEGGTTPASPVAEAALGTLPPVLAFAVRSDSPDARLAGPALPPPPPPGPDSREDADQSRDWRWGWPAVTIMALVGSAVMIFRLHATQRSVGHPG